MNGPRSSVRRALGPDGKFGKPRFRRLDGVYHPVRRHRIDDRDGQPDIVQIAFRLRRASAFKHRSMRPIWPGPPL